MVQAARSFSFLRTVTSVVIVLLTLTGLSETNTNSDSEAELSVKFILRNQTYLNNSIVPINDIGEGDNALLCVTDKPDCCSNRVGEFYYPDNTAVGFSSTNPLYRNRGPQVVRLNRRNNVLSPTGIYRCEIPDANGNMQDVYIDITAVNCGSPLPISNGHSVVPFSTTFGGTVTYSCNSGYILSGSANVTCLANQKWSTQPSCTGTCPDLPALANGAITYSPTSSPRLERTTAIHSCNTGYVLSDRRGRTCQSDRTWSEVDITCLPTCTDLPHLTNGAITYSPTSTPRLVRTTATYRCDNGYIMSGGTVRTCQSNRTWSGRSITCQQITAGVVPPSDPPAFGQSYTLRCTVTGADSFNPTINYKWFRTTLNRTQVGTNSPTFTFEALVLSDVGQYSCEVTISSTVVSQNITAVSGYFYLRFSTLNIQLRLNGILNCRQYTTSETNQKAQDITTRVARGIISICGCGFNTTFITNSFLKCFYEDSPQHVTYRAMLVETDLITTVQLVLYIEQWAIATQSLVVQSVQLGINTTCPVVIVDLTDSPECPETIGNQVTSPTSSTHVVSSSGENGLVVGGAIVGVLLIVVVAAAVVVVLVLVMMRKKTGSLNVQSSGPKIETQPVPLSELNQSLQPQPYEIVTQTQLYETIATDHEYEDLKFREGPVPEYAQVVQLQTHPPEGGYDLTDCPAYLPTDAAREVRVCPSEQEVNGDT